MSGKSTSPPPEGVSNALQRRQSISSSRRVTVAVACEECRRRKTKCNGQRPQCTNCSKNHYSCVYQFDQGERSRVAALKRKYDAADLELSQLKDLYEQLKRRPKLDADDILAHIRSSEGLESVLRFAKKGNVLPVSPSSPSGFWTDLELENLDAEALNSSPIKVPARPWTEIANNGLVSSLMSAFFIWDETFYFRFVDRESFVEDMLQQDPERARFCSPLLVNAICANRCFTSPYVRRIKRHTGIDLGAKFFDEAKRLFELEYGRASLPTVQALGMLFVVSSHFGMDRAGSIYRCSAIEMLKRLGLEGRYRRLASSTQPTDQRECQVISKALWGYLVYESFCAYMYLQPSLLPPPRIPRCFVDITTSFSDQQTTIDILGNAFSAESPQPPLVSGVFNAACDLSVLLYESMQYNTSELNEIGSGDDLTKRKELYTKLTRWRDGVPSSLREDANFTPSTCYLTIYMNEVALSIIRPLDPETFFHDGILRVRDLSLRYCKLDTLLMAQYLKRWPLGEYEYSCMFLCAPYNTSLTLAYLLDDSKTHATFAQACFMLRMLMKDFPVARFLLQGIQALAWGLSLQLPVEALSFFNNLGPSKESLLDVPMGYIVPQHTELAELFADDDRDPALLGNELGQLLSRWSSMSIT